MTEREKVDASGEYGRKVAFEATALKKQESSLKAQHILLRLIENPVDEDWFIHAGGFLNQSKYSDVVEERSVSLACGYPLCTNTLAKPSPHTYAINTNNNKVYDIAERKKFCSGHCYHASSHYYKQLLDTPLWLVEKEKSPKITLLTEATRITSDDSEILLISNDIKEALSSLSDDDKIRDKNSNNQSTPTDAKPLKGILKTKGDVNDKSRQCQFKTSDSSETVTPNAADKNNSKRSINKCGTTCDDDPLTVKFSKLELSATSDSSKGEPNSMVEDSDHSCPKDKNSVDPKCDTSSNPEQATGYPRTSERAPVLHIEKCLGEWFTFRTLQYLFINDHHLQILLQQKGVDYDKYMEFTDDLQQESDEVMEVDQLSCEYSNLHDEVDEQQQKVSAFMRGRDKVMITERGKVKSEVKEREEVSDPVLPPVDHHSQLPLRRNILLAKINNVLPGLLDVLEFSSAVHVATSLSSLISTYSLTSTNITFKPAQWTLIALISLQMLSVREVSVLTALKDHADFVKTLLSGYSLDAGYLQRLLDWLIDTHIHNTMHNNNTPTS